MTRLSTVEGLNISVGQLEPGRFAAYDAFVDGDGMASIYHARVWHEFLRQAYDVEPIVFVAECDGQIVAAMPFALQRQFGRPRRLSSLPFSHFVPPLGSEVMVERLWRHAVDFGLRQYGCRVELHATLPTHSSFKPFVNTIIPLPASADGMIASFRPNTRQKLKQALRNEDLTVRQAVSTEDFDAMDDIMADNRRHLRSGTYPKGFFILMARLLGTRAKLDLCLLRGDPIALMGSTITSRTAIHNYGASLSSPEARRLRPNNLLIWNGIQWAIANGVDRFDLGTSLHSQDGLIHFKEGWGGVTSELAYTAVDRHGKPCGGILSQEGVLVRVAGAALACMPMPLFKRITPILVKQFG